MKRQKREEVAIHLFVLGFALLATAALFLAEYMQILLPSAEPWFVILQAAFIFTVALFFIFLALSSPPIQGWSSPRIIGFLLEVAFAYIMAVLSDLLTAPRIHGIALFGFSLGLMLLSCAVLSWAVSLFGIPVGIHIRYRSMKYLRERIEVLKAVLFYEEVKDLVRKLRAKAKRK